MRHTLDQSGAALGQVFDDHIPATVSQETEQRRRLLVLGDVVAHVHGATVALGQDVDLIAAGVLEQEPVGRAQLAGSASWVCTKLTWHNGFFSRPCAQDCIALHMRGAGVRNCPVCNEKLHITSHHVPSSGLCDGGLVGFLDGGSVQAVERHGCEPARRSVQRRVSRRMGQYAL